MGGQVQIDRKIFNGSEFRFGFMGDTHLASRWARVDALEAMYDLYAAEGITTVFHGGNLIDGECRFNKFDLLAHGIEGQCALAAKQYPKRKGIVTKFIAGDDHEGWYVQREGVDIGRVMEDRFRAAGREDLQYIGYMEADIKLPTPDGKSQTWIRLIHPGGGSAYALSYAAQKLVECVPLDTEILTPQGWKLHNEIAQGAVVMGYNKDFDRCEWTKVTHLNTGIAEVATYENDQFKVRCTRNHRWAMERESRGGPNPQSSAPSQYSRRTRLLGTIDDAKERTRIIQAAPGPDGPGYSPANHAAIVDREATVEAVLQMTSAQRKSFIYGMMVGEGTLSGNGDTPVFSQNPGAVQDAFVLACFLEGIATGVARKTSKKINGEDKICCRTTVLKKRMRMATRSLRKACSKIEDVWCPTTELGTWVMRQDGVVSITGNSFQGGEKPAVLLIGHYHKMDFCLPREVFCVQGGCFQDQTPFMRKNKLQAHVGGWICRLIQAPDGHVSRFSAEFVRFYDRGFYDKGEKFPRW
jgi:hypothetical protein